MTNVTTKYFSVGAVADRWSVSSRTVVREIERGRLTAHRFGRSVRISHDDLMTYERLHRGAERIDARRLTVAGQ